MAAGLRPNADFARVNLDFAHFAAGARFGRSYFERHTDPLGFGKFPSRFSDPRRRRREDRFGVLYVGETLQVCFLEAVLRDKRNGAIGDYPLDDAELSARRYAVVEAATAVSMVDLRSDGAVRMGVPSDVAHASDQRLARAWSLAFQEHPSMPDGVAYSSRLNGQTNLAFYDRAVPKLRAVETMPLIRAPGLAAVLDELLVTLVP